MNIKLLFCALLYQSIIIHASTTSKNLAPAKTTVQQEAPSLEYLCANMSALKQEITSLRVEQKNMAAQLASFQEQQQRTCDHMNQINDCQKHHSEHIGQLLEQEVRYEHQFVIAQQRQTCHAETVARLQQEHHILSEKITHLQNQQSCQEERITTIQSQQEKQKDDQTYLGSTLHETNKTLRQIATILELSQKHSARGVTFSMEPARKIDRPCRKKEEQKPLAPWRY